MNQGYRTSDWSRRVDESRLPKREAPAYLDMDALARLNPALAGMVQRVQDCARIDRVSPYRVERAEVPKETPALDDLMEILSYQAETTTLYGHADGLLTPAPPPANLPYNCHVCGSGHAELADKRACWLRHRVAWPTPVARERTPAPKRYHQPPQHGTWYGSPVTPVSTLQWRERLLAEQRAIADAIDVLQDNQGYHADTFTRAVERTMASIVVDHLVLRHDQIDHILG